MKTERWKQVAGFDSYAVSSHGRVKRSIQEDSTRVAGILSPGFTKGYPVVNLYNKGVRFHTTVHRLVATAFIEKPCHATQVNHKDGNKANNRVENLEWVTHKENGIHAGVVGLLGGRKAARGELNGSTRLTEDDVRLIRHQYKSGISSPKIAAMFGIHYSAAWKIATRKSWSHIVD